MLTGNSVTVQDGNVEKALRKLKKKVADSKVLLELKEREAYIKPTTRRKIKAAQARSRHLKQKQQKELPKPLF